MQGLNNISSKPTCAQGTHSLASLVTESKIYPSI